MNKDGSNILLKVTTHSGREVIATKAKSFLKRVDNKIIGVNGADIKVGDYLPVSNILPDMDNQTMEWDLSLYLSKTKYIFMSEVEKGIEIFKNKKSPKQPWFKENLGKKFTVPYNRSDTFAVAFIGVKDRDPIRKSIMNMETKNVYPLFGACGGHKSADTWKVLNQSLSLITTLTLSSSPLLSCPGAKHDGLCSWNVLTMNGNIVLASLTLLML